MSNYDDNLTGILSKNDRKTKPEHADYSGKCEIEGTDYYIDGWIRQRKDGSGSFLSLRFKAKGQAAATSGYASADEVPDF